MQEWQEMPSAPTDGTWIIGRDKDGREARIQSRQIHPQIADVRSWMEGEEKQEGHWLVSKSFRPVQWHPE